MGSEMLRLRRPVVLADRILWERRYTDTRGYFRNSELRRALNRDLPVRKFRRVLEIGTFEGIFACYAAESFAEHVDTVDPFMVSDPGTWMHLNVEANFRRNVKARGVEHLVTQYKMTSSQFFTQNSSTYDFIYIDGSHEPDVAVSDLNSALNILHVGGYLWVDDYGSNYEGLNAAIASWADEQVDILEKVHEGYQVGFRRVY